MLRFSVASILITATFISRGERQCSVFYAISMVNDTPSQIVNGNTPFLGAFFGVFCKNERQCSVFQAVSKPFFTSKVGGLNRLDWVGMLRFRQLTNSNWFRLQTTCLSVFVKITSFKDYLLM